MIVHLNQNEIHEALVEYISNQGYPVTGKKVIVTLVAGRKDKNGHTAQLDFETVANLPDRVAPETDVDENQQAISFDFQHVDSDD